MESNDEQFHNDRRLWIGNLDPKVTEYHLLKLVQKYGSIEKFDLLFHRTGPMLGQPRGYAFVTYLTAKDANTAKNQLNNKLVGQKYIKITWAHNVKNEEFVEKAKIQPHIPALAIAKSDQKTDRNSQIQAIEAKLKAMERKTDDELRINDTVATKNSVLFQYQANKDKDLTSASTSMKNRQSLVKRKERFNKPYNKSKFR